MPVIRAMIILSILAFAFLRPSTYLYHYYSLADSNLLPLALWIIGGTAPLYFVHGQFITPTWSTTLIITGLSTSIVVNIIAISLIVFSIFKVFRQVKATSDEQILGTTGGSTLRPIIFVLIESGMVLFSIQMARLVVVSLLTWKYSMGAQDTFFFIASVHGMINASIRSDISTLYILLIM